MAPSLFGTAAAPPSSTSLFGQSPAQREDVPDEEDEGGDQAQAQESQAIRVPSYALHSHCSSLRYIRLSLCEWQVEVGGTDEILFKATVALHLTEDQKVSWQPNITVH